MDKVNAYREQNGIRAYESPYTYYDVANPEYGDSLSDKGDRVCKHVILNWGEMIEDGQMSTGDIETLMAPREMGPKSFGEILLCP